MTERDWEAASARRLENLVADTVSRMRDAADQIERDARRNLASAQAETRDLEFHTYTRVAGQVIHDLQTLMFNVKLDSLVDAGNDAETARTEKRSARATSASLTAWGVLQTLHGVLDGWIEGARANHDGLGHRGELVGGECWTQYAPADIRNMINDAARELGLAEIPAPAKPKEDEVR